MAVVVLGEVGRMALDAGAACAAVDAGVAMAVDANPAVAVGRIVAGGAGSVHSSDDIAGMAGNAGGGGSH